MCVECCFDDDDDDDDDDADYDDDDDEKYSCTLNPWGRRRYFPSTCREPRACAQRRSFIYHKIRITGLHG